MKKIASIVGLLMLLGGAASAIWGLSTNWHGYCAKEQKHEAAQDEKITIALNFRELTLAQQRLEYLERRLYELEQQAGCPNCHGRALRSYRLFLEEYNQLQRKVKALMGN